MTKSLVGGLVPLGKGSTPGSSGSNTLSGGLIPLTGQNKSRSLTAAAAGGSTATFGRLGQDSDGSDDWDKDDDKSTSAGDAAGGSFTFTEGNNESNQASGRGKGAARKKNHGGESKRRETEGDSSSRSRSRKEKSGRGDGEDRQQKSGLPLAVADDDGDDEYLFMGATAKAKGGRRSGTGVAEAAALLLGESDDSFSFASMPRAKKAEPTVADKSSPRGRSRIEDILSTGSTDRMKTPDDNLETTREEGEGSAPTALGSGRRDSTRPATANAGDVQPGSETSFRGLASTSSVGRTPSGGTNQSAHVDSADGVDEADELLRMTDPDALARISTDRSTAAAGGIPAASAEDTRQGVSRRSRFTALSSPITDSAGTGTDSWGNPTGGPRRRSPSPPSHARTQQSASPEGSPRRVLLSHSVAVAGRGESTSTIDKTTEEPGSGRSYESGDTVDGGQANGDRSEVGGHRYGTSEKHKMSIESAAEDSKFTSRSLGDGEERYSHSAPGIGGAANPTTSTTGTLPLRSALANRDKARKCVNKTHGVSFDDDLGIVDALDILPGSDDDAPASPAADVPGFGESSSPASLDVTPSSFPSTVTPRPSAKDETSSGGVDNKNDRRIATEEAERLKDNVDHFPTFAIQSTTRTSGTTMNRSAQRSTSITAGLSREAARLVTQSSSSDDEQDLVFSQKTDIDSRLGLGPLAAPEKNAKGVARTPAVAADGSDDDDAKLDLVLGFTPSAMDGGRRQRRALSVGGRRRPRADSSLTPEDNRRETPTFTAQRSALASTALASAAAAAGEKEKVTVVAEPVCAPEQAEKSKLDRVDSLALPESASQSPKTLSNKVGPNTEVLTDGAAQQIKLDKTTTGAAEVPRTLKVTDGSGGGGTASAMAGDRKGRTDVGCYSTRSERHTAVGAESVHSSVLSSFERQLVLLTNEKENATTRFAKQEEKLEQEAAASKAAAAAAEARAADADSALATARARIRQLEAEALGLKTAVAAVEARAASDLSSEQASSIRKMAEAETRHQNDIRASAERNEEALSELKRLHREELEDVRRRSMDSQTLETLAGQVQASAGALKLLQADMVERKGAAEVSREGQMDARERLIQELESSAKRAQQTADDEVQRLQGTLMAMDQVMRGIRGQNAGERERLRQEHLRLDALQGSMVAEVGAMREGVEEEHKRLTERSAAIERQKRETDITARAERERLGEQRRKLETERQEFADFLVSSAQAAEEMAKRQAEEEQRLDLARQSLDKEAMSLEARLMAARADLQKAEDVRATLDRAQDQQELERRRLTRMAADLKHAFDDVSIRGAEIEKRWRETESMRAQAMEASSEARKATESIRLRSAQVEESARRQDEERTIIAQARAQSATELSVSRRLKSELTRAVVAQQNQRRHMSQPMLMPGDVNPTALRPAAKVSTSHNPGSPSSAALQEWRRSVDCGNAAGAMRPHTLGHEEERKTQRVASGDRGSPNAEAIPNTGLAAAEATLEAAASTPSSAGLDVGKELARLAQRATEMRRCTREQRAFLSNARITTTLFPSSLSSPVTPEVSVPTDMQRALHGITPIRPGTAALSMLSSTTTTNHVLRPPRENGAQWKKGCEDVMDIVGGPGWGFSKTVMEEMEDIERACSKRTSLLEEDAPFLETLGRSGSSS